MDNFEERVESTLETFRQYVVDRGHQITPDGRVVEAVAADLVGRQPKTLGNMRNIGTGPRYYRISGRIEYRLQDLALWVEQGAEDPVL